MLNLKFIKPVQNKLIKLTKEIKDGFISSIAIDTISLLQDKASLLGYVSIYCLLFGLSFLVPSDIFWYLCLIFSELTNIDVSLSRTYLSDRDQTIKMIKNYLTSRFMFLFFIYSNADDYLSLLFYPLDMLISSVIMSYYLLDLTLSLQGKDFSFRVNYFKDHALYYMGFGLPITLAYFLDYPFIYLIFNRLCLFSSSITSYDEKDPIYTRWLPVKGRKLIIDIDEILELSISKSLNFVESKLIAESKLISENKLVQQ